MSDEKTIVVAFTQNRDLFTIMERNAKVWAGKFMVFNPENCKCATREAELAIDQLRIIRPRIVVEATSKKESLEEADIIIIPGLFLPSKNDDQFAAISKKVISETFNGLMLKEECKFFICGSFRGLIIANHLGETIDEKHMRDIDVIDPYVYTGIRLYECENVGEPVLYPNSETIFSVINGQAVDEDDKAKIRALKVKEEGRAREIPAIEREALGHALQQYVESKKSLALVGRFPTQDEQVFYGIANFPVILPADPNSEIKNDIKSAVKKLADQLSSVQPEENESDLSD